MNGFRKVFAFTLKQLTNTKMYRMLTLIVAILLFAVPVLVLPLMEKSDMNHAEGEVIDVSEDTDEDVANADEAEVVVEPLEILYLVDDYDACAWADVLEKGLPGYEDCKIIPMPSIEAANDACKDGENSVILSLSNKEEGSKSLMINSLVPDKSASSSTLAWMVVESFQNHLPTLLAPELSEADLAKLDEIREAEYEAAEQAALEEAQAAEADEAEAGEQSDEEAITEMLQNMFGFILPYLNIMVIYFLVLYYGQTVANNVIQEKSSKLMDTLLISVKPREMIMGKVVATWFASLIQFLTWVIALFAGIGLGIKIVMSMNPDTQNIVIFVIEIFKHIMGTFAIPAIALAVLIVFAGFFLYCALSAIGGSLASKPEELSSTNILFVVILIGSFLVALSSGFLNGEAAIGLTLFDYIPFTAVLLTPSRILLGQVSFAGGLVSLGIIVILSVVLMMIAAKVYTMMAMYRGKAPNPKQLIRMLQRK